MSRQSIENNESIRNTSSFITYNLSCIRDISRGLNCWRFNKSPLPLMSRASMRLGSPRALRSVFSPQSAPLLHAHLEKNRRVWLGPSLKLTPTNCSSTAFWPFEKEAEGSHYRWIKSNGRINIVDMWSENKRPCNELKLCFIRTVKKLISMNVQVRRSFKVQLA